ncbi:hypothetical protein C2E23DRAFT_746242, partial [Lenzites betulinus]
MRSKRSHTLFPINDLMGRPLLCGASPSLTPSASYEVSCSTAEAHALCVSSSMLYAVHVPTSVLICRLNATELFQLATCHGLRGGRSTRTAKFMRGALEVHQCMCAPIWSVFRIPQIPTYFGGAIDNPEPLLPPSFPPAPRTLLQQAVFLQRWSDEFRPSSVYERPCAVCACLIYENVLISKPLSEVDLSPLVRDGHGVTRVERCHVGDPHILLCAKCDASLKRGELPLLALANGRWLGEIPDQLKNLSYAEELLISRFRRNYCVAHVNGDGQGFMRANAILFEQPVLQVYDVLPPPQLDVSETFAIIFTGSSKPTPEEYIRTPFIVRHRVVLAALRWLKLNHVQYQNVLISTTNMMQYEDDSPPVYIIHR